MVHPPAFMDVIIVGAGLNGLRAATEIHSAGLSYIFLEAENRVGGKTLSVLPSANNSARVELGSAWINGSNQSEMLRACRSEDGGKLRIRACGMRFLIRQRGKSLEF